MNDGSPAPAARCGAELRSLARRALATLAETSKARTAIAPLVHELERRGASQARHSKRSFLDHLVGTWRILTMWGQSEGLRRAGLFHSVYGTQYFQTSLAQASERAAVRALVGHEAEEIALLFCTLDRRDLDRWAEELREIPVDGVPVRSHTTGLTTLVAPEQLADLYVLAAANLAEQLGEESRSPGPWAPLVSRYARLAVKRRALPPSVFGGNGAIVDRDSDKLATEHYAAALVADSLDESERAASLACSRNPWVGEPHLALALAAAERGRADRVIEHAEAALWRLLDWGTAWDKQQSWAAWVATGLLLRADALEAGGAASEAATDRCLATAFEPNVARALAKVRAASDASSAPTLSLSLLTNTERHSPEKRTCEIHFEDS